MPRNSPEAEQLGFDVSDPLADTGDLFPGASPASAIEVSTLTETAREIIEGAFPPMWVRGEVTDFKKHRSGHWYFCLRDRRGQVNCVVWAKDTRRIPAPPDDGMQVAAFGRLTVYPARGSMQFTVTKMEAEGDGLRQKALELTRRRLEADGLLDPARKRRIPMFPRVVAVITSPDGAALRDIVAVTRRRGMGVHLVVVPAAVQGDTAVRDLVAAIDRVRRWGRADVVIIGRGGGAREDLWAFNDERVARALAKSPVPTISAVGHEIDVTICDLVADVRAPTPSAAAELATRSRDELQEVLASFGARLRQQLRSRVEHARFRLRAESRALARAGRSLVQQRQTRVESLAGRLHALSPVATLARGFAVARSEDGRTLSAVGDFVKGERFDLIVRDGEVRARVEP